MLTTLPQNDLLDLQPWVGQRSSTFTFELVNGLTGEHLGFITPIRGSTLSHDTSRTIMRQLQIGLGKVDTATIDPLTARVLVSMKLGDGSVWPLGRYMFTDQTKIRFTSGTLSNAVLNDEMFLVDQVLVKGFDAAGLTVPSAYAQLLADLPITFNATGASGGFTMSQAWSAGTFRGAILKALAVGGDFFNPWFANDSQMHLIRTFNPADQVPQLDWDSGNQVYRDGITETSNVLTAPNRFLVTSNTTRTGPVTAVATVPITAPHSFANRGFYITEAQTLQLTTGDQAQAVANGLANRMTVFETVNLDTAPDPRHDSYDVIKWQGSLWLELSWSMNLIEGGRMRHVLRKGYA